MMLPFILYPTPNKRDLLRERGKTGKQFYFSSLLLPCSILRAQDNQITAKVLTLDYHTQQQRTDTSWAVYGGQVLLTVKCIFL